MKRFEKGLIVYSICSTILCTGLLYGYYDQMDRMQMDTVEAKEADVIEVTTEEKEVFRLTIQDGHVVILKNGTIFENTDIKEHEMTEEQKKEVESSLEFQSEAEVYAFLESYTS